MEKLLEVNKIYKFLVKSGKGYILLEQFVDIYGPMEENIMIQSHIPESKSGKNLEGSPVGFRKSKL